MPAGFAELARVVRGRVIAVDAGPLLAHLEGASVREVEAGALSSLADEECDAVLVGGLGAAAPLELARALAPRLRAGGTLTFALPTTRPGLKGATGSLLGLLRRQKPVLLEDLCEALLLAGLHELDARELDGPTGTSLVTAHRR